MSLTTRNILYKGNPVLGRLFTMTPWKVFALASAFSSFFLLLPAWLINIHSIPIKTDLNEGFFSTWNWSLMYVIVIPMLLSMAASVSENMKSCVVELVEKGRIVPRKESGKNDLPRDMSEYLMRRAGLLVKATLFVAIATTLVDTSDLWRGFVSDQVPETRNPGWDTAFNASNWKIENPSAEFQTYLQNRPLASQNFLFDVIAYSFQTSMLFLGLFWVGTFTRYLFRLAKVISGQDKKFLFIPNIPDIHFRMGLMPMGGVFNSFLAITLAIVGYAFYHRIYLIDSGRGDAYGTYIRTIFWKVIKPTEDPSVSFPFNHLVALFDSKAWAFDVLDASGIFTIAFMTVPIVIICALPLWHIRNLLDMRRNEEMVKLDTDYQKAWAANDEAGMAAVQRKKSHLEKTEIWPNGSVLGMRYLKIIFALAIGAFAPPLLAIILTVAISDEILKFVKMGFGKV